MLGTGGVLTYGALAWWSVEYRIRRAEVPLYSETVAFSAPGVRELVPTGHPDAVVPGTRVLAARPLSTMLVEDEQAWLEGCAPWVRTALDGGDDVLRSALLDLRALSVGLPVCVAGWSEKWRYAWPRDVSFVATALARTGHPEHAAEQLALPAGGAAPRRLVRGALRPAHPPHPRRPGGPARRVGLVGVGRPPARPRGPRPGRRAADPPAPDARAQRPAAARLARRRHRCCRWRRRTTGSWSSAR